MSRRRVLLGLVSAGVVAAVAAGVATGATRGLLPTGGSGATGSTQAPNASGASQPKTAEVERRTMQTTQDLDGTLGYGDTMNVLAGTAGVLTWVPSNGTLVRRGGPLYEVNGTYRPRLFYGSRPMWRQLGPGVGNGADVEQLERNLKALGYTASGMDIDRHWDSDTTRAVRRWQKATDQTRDGIVDPGDVVFLPGAVRVRDSQAAVGSQVGPGAAVLSVTSATRVVTVSLEASDSDSLHKGDKVQVELPDDSLVDGTVTEVAKVAHVDEQSGSATIPVTITLDDPGDTPDLDQLPVTVHSVTEEHKDVLVVPVTALVALLEGGYAVEVVDGDGSRHYVKVEPGLYDDSYVEVSGNGIDVGTRVLVAQ
jgi:peptidoglycan hydrolase-like protein with peptidoglycan-binding domain